MGANIALFNYLYYISFDMKLHVNEQSICNVYISHIVIVSSIYNSQCTAILKLTVEMA